jgi:hypothetical protein
MRAEDERRGGRNWRLWRRPIPDPVQPKDCLPIVAEAGIDEGLIDQMLNHRASASQGGVIGTYLKATKIEQRRATMDRWVAITRGGLTGETGNVVAFASL